MKKKNNIFKNKLEELDKLTIEAKKEILAKKKEQEEKENKEKENKDKLFEIKKKKLLKDYDLERSELKNFIKEVNKKFYKKYEMNIINPLPKNTEGFYCKETSGYSSYIFHALNTFEINIFSLDVLDKSFQYEEPTSTKISLNYINSDNSHWPSRFKVEIGDEWNKKYSPGLVYIRKDFAICDHGSKAKKLAIEDFMIKLTDQIKLL